MRAVRYATFSRSAAPRLRARLAVLLSLSCLPPCAGQASAGRFERDRIHADYEGGEFDRVIRALERFRESGLPCARQDSLFMEKHLGVVYAANPATRERGRYHFLRMLAIDPRADLLDMFVGDEVDGIFGKVRREFAHTEAAKGGAKAARRPARPAAGRAGSRAVPKARQAVSARTADPRTQAVRTRPQPTPGLDSWSLQSAPPSVLPPFPLPPPAPVQPAAGRIRPTPASLPAASAFSWEPEAAAPAAPDSAARPSWREPGFWVGGGAAVAVIGLTLYFAGRGPEEPAPRERIFHVPARPAQ